MGSSATAGFVQLARMAGAHTIEINLKATGGRFAEARTGSGTRRVPELVDELLE